MEKVFQKLRRLGVRIRNSLIFKWYDLLAKIRSQPFESDPQAGFVVSIASYPQRDPLLPAVFQALSRQTVLPKKWILVLSEEEYPDGLPAHLKKLKKRGVEILWACDNPYAVKKLIPVIERYSELAVVTLDDDIIYNSQLLEGIIIKINDSEQSIIGYVGKALVQKAGLLNMYLREPEAANSKTPPEQVYLIGWGGIYYPPNSLESKVLNMDAVHEIVPGRGSDIWFWAAAHAKGTKQVCLGVPTGRNLGIPIPQNRNTAPKDTPGKDSIEKRFQMAIDYFDIREKLLEVLPDHARED